MAAEATSDSVASLEQARQQILQQVATLGDFRPGHLHRTLYQVPQAGLPLPPQGPSRPRVLLPAASPPRRQQTHHPQCPTAGARDDSGPGRRLRRLVAELIEISERLFDAPGGESGTARRQDPETKAPAQLFGPAIEAEIDRFVSLGAVDTLD